MNDVTPAEFAQLFSQETPLIDVRAPVEYEQGRLPGAMNLFLMNDQERAAVGTAYKKQGREAAIALGHDLVSGDLREQRIELWSEHIRRHPDAVIYCFRGGLRSKTTQQWLAGRGIHRPLIEGGYKKARQYLRNEIEKFSVSQPLLMLSGATGSAKTHLLRRTTGFYPSLDLEKYACHRGSAFGSLPQGQPTQIDFEHQIAVQILKIGTTQAKILVEDESRLIGRCAIPEEFFLKMRASPLLYLDVPLDQRVENIYQDYILATAIGGVDSTQALVQFQVYRNAMGQISKKLGGARAQELMKDLDFSQKQYLSDPSQTESNKLWIKKLLLFYYDPFYTSSLNRRSPEILVRGSAETIFDYLRSQL